MFSIGCLSAGLKRVKTIFTTRSYRNIEFLWSLRTAALYDFRAERCATVRVADGHSTVAWWTSSVAKVPATMKLRQTVLSPDHVCTRCLDDFDRVSVFYYAFFSFVISTRLHHDIGCRGDVHDSHTSVVVAVVFFPEQPKRRVTRATTCDGGKETN